MTGVWCAAPLYIRSPECLSFDFTCMCVLVLLVVFQICDIASTEYFSLVSMVCGLLILNCGLLICAATRTICKMYQLFSVDTQINMGEPKCIWLVAGCVCPLIIFVTLYSPWVFWCGVYLSALCKLNDCYYRCACSSYKHIYKWIWTFVSAVAEFVLATILLIGVHLKWLLFSKAGHLFFFWFLETLASILVVFVIYWSSLKMVG